MERAIVRSDLTKKEIQPPLLLKKYLAQLGQDIRRLLPAESLKEVSCPITGEEAIRDTFKKMEMQYNVSKSLGNIYLSPRPSMRNLIRFYHESTARKFWLNELWSQTQEARQEKIILPQLEWAQGFISQYTREKGMLLAEFFPNHWGYFNSAKKLFTESKYTLVEPFFDPEIASINLHNLDTIGKVPGETLDSVFLFEALDRSVDPLDLLRKSFNSLKKGGLCFITSLLSSGFEVQLLGEKSEIFVPPERMNILSYEGMNALIEKLNGFDILEFSTPGVLDITNVVSQIADLNNSVFFKYIIEERQDPEILNSFQDYLQANRLGTFARLVLRKY